MNHNGWMVTKLASLVGEIEVSMLSSQFKYKIYNCYQYIHMFHGSQLVFVVYNKGGKTGHPGDNVATIARPKMKRYLLGKNNIYAVHSDYFYCEYNQNSESTTFSSFLN